MDDPLSHPSLDSVARRAGVSKMTASRALRNAGRISAETRERVLAAARELEYRPNPLVQTLMSSVRRRKIENAANLAWVTTERSPRPAHRLIEKGAKERAEELGFGLEEIQPNGLGGGSARLRRVFRARGVVGAIIAPLATAGSIEFPWESIPVSAIGGSLISPRVHYVMAHYYHMMNQALTELTLRGYRRIGFLNTRAMDARADHAPFASFGHPIRAGDSSPELMMAFCDDWTSEQFRDWQRKNRSDVVLGVHSAAFDWLEAAGIHVPDDVSFATLSWSEARPNCAGIRHPWEAMGAGAVDLVVAQLHRNECGVPARRKAMLFEGDWVEGLTLPQTP